MDKQLKAYARDLARSYRASRELKEQYRLLKENAQLREDIEQITRHDLKSPLSVVLLYSQMLAVDGNLTRQQRSALRMIEKAGHRMLGMINRSLDLYKMEAGTYRLKKAAVNLVPLAFDCIEQNRDIITAKNLTTAVSLNGRPAPPSGAFVLPGESLLFFTMLGNLLNNALEASPNGETVSVTFSNDHGSTIRIHNHGAVPEEIRDRFFEKFVTAGKMTGTGLGTYSARMIAKTLGGRMTLEPSAENETTVQIVF